MCMSIVTLNAGERIELIFALERIFLTNSGSIQITTDLLIENTGGNPISALRLIIPYGPVAVNPNRFRNWSKRTSEQQARIFGKLVSEQTGKIFEETSQLAHSQDAPENWPYRTLPHVKLGFHNMSTGVQEVLRDGAVLKGFIKGGWKAGLQKDLKNNPWVWLVLAVNEVTVVDLEAPGEIAQLRRGENERMWLRVRFTVPGIQRSNIRHHFGARILSEHLEHVQLFMAPEAVHNWVKSRLNQFQADKLPFKPGLTDLLRTAVPQAIKVVEVPAPAVKDWRSVMYAAPAFLSATATYNGSSKQITSPFEGFPPEAYGKQQIFRRPIKPFEFWIGGDHGCKDADCSVEVRAQWRNPLYTRLIWISIVLALIALGLEIRHSYPAMGIFK
jgi:hypothetical protein